MIKTDMQTEFKNERRNLCTFGYGLAVIIIYFYWRHTLYYPEISSLDTSFLIVALLFVIVTFFDYTLLRPIYKKWMIMTRFIGGIVTFLLLSMIFYFIFGIAGLVLRLMKKDLLDRQWQPDAASYWRKREKRTFNKEDYLKQF